MFSDFAVQRFEGRCKSNSLPTHNMGFKLHVDIEHNHLPTLVPDTFPYTCRTHPAAPVDPPILRVANCRVCVFYRELYSVTKLGGEDVRKHLASRKQRPPIAREYLPVNAESAGGRRKYCVSLVAKSGLPWSEIRIYDKPPFARTCFLRSSTAVVCGLEL